MNDDRSFERLLADRMEAERGSAQLPDSFYDDFRQRASGTRQRPPWLALIKEPPMRTSSGLAVGSPTARVAIIVVATLLLALTLAGAGIAGVRLFAADGTIVVDPSGNGTTTTITEAVAMAEDGDTILVRPGTYDEAIVLDKDVTIRGDGDRDEVVVELSVALPPGGTNNPPGLPTAFLIESADAILENLTVRGEASRIVINGGAPELRDLVFDGVGRVYLLDPTAPSGLLIDNGSTALIENNVMADTDVGIRPGSSPTLRGNEISIGAIWIEGPGAEPVIHENTIVDSVKWGIQIWDARPEIVGNTIVDTDVGISTSASDASLIGNTVSGGRVGINIQGGSPTLEANEVEGAERGLVIGVGTTPTLEGNTVCGNTTNLVVNVPEGAEVFDTTGNEICAGASGDASE